ncbi:MAG: hypothetical protein LBM64_00585, partial [Deltaproteobacteria bacterium]|nr:hypothetical protein [Deltaproteobacteria bacterium]
ANKSYISGGLILGPVQRWQALRDSFQEAMRRLLDLNLTDHDQTLALMSCRSAPRHYALRKIHNFFQPLFLTGGSHLRYIKVERHIYRGCRDKLREARAGDTRQP